MKYNFIFILSALFITLNTSAQKIIINFTSDEKVTYDLSKISNIEFEEGDPYNGHDYVDLGLSVKWAVCNIGATKREEYGQFFAWGETKTKSKYTSDTYKYYKTTVESVTDSEGFTTNKTYSGYTKYVPESWAIYYGYKQFYDEKSKLDLEDDAARQIWGGLWRMPTSKEAEELVSKCTWTFGAINGVNGFLVKGPNGNSIFLPASGFDDNGLGKYEKGRQGAYWTSEIGGEIANTGNTAGCRTGQHIGFSDTSSHPNIKGLSRFYGLNIRPVCP